MAQRLARVAHNHEDTGSKPVAGIYLHIATVHQGTWAQLHRHGAEAARRAHNPEVTRSKRVAGIIPFAKFYRNWPSSWTLNAAFVAGIAQRQSA